MLIAYELSVTTIYIVSSNSDLVLAQLRDVEAGMWLGLRLWASDFSNEPWLWVDNSHVTYTNWLRGEPSIVSDTIFLFL